jgi:hypothetical protein
MRWTLDCPVSECPVHVESSTKKETVKRYLYGPDLEVLNRRVSGCTVGVHIDMYYCGCIA